MQSTLPPDPLKRHYSVAVVGGGVAGLSALWNLQGRDAVLFEASDIVGGRTASMQIGPFWANLGAHILAGAHSPMAKLAKDVGVELTSIPGAMHAVWQNGRLVHGGRLETYPLRLRLPLSARLSMLKSGMRLLSLSLQTRKYNKDAMHGEREIAGEYATASGDPELDQKTFGEALGTLHPEIKQFYRTATNRLGAELHEMSAGFGATMIGGRLHHQHSTSWTAVGGTDAIAKAIAQKCSRQIHLSTPVMSIEVDKSQCVLSLRTDQGVKQVTADYVIAAVPAHTVREVVKDLPDAKKQALARVKYGPYLVMIARTKETRPMAYEDIYAISVVGRTICMLYNPLNPQRPLSSERQPGGVLAMYAAADKGQELMGCSDEQIRARYLADLYEIFPETRGLIEDTYIQRWPHGYPFWQPGRLAQQTEIAQPFGRLFFAGDYVEYPATDPAAHSGLVAATAIINRLNAAIARPELAAVTS